jgi:hypothetical protein
MRTQEYIAWGAVIGMVAVQFTLTAVMRGPGPEAPGEATASVLGVVVDRVSIPPDPDGRAGLPTDRILRGLLATMIGAAVTSGCLGGLIGWAVGRSRNKRRHAEPGVASDPATR